MASNFAIFVLCFSGLVTGFDTRRLLQNVKFEGQTCVYEEGCKPNPELSQTLITSSNPILQKQAECVAYGIDNVTCSTIPQCSVVADTGEYLNSDFSEYGLCVRKSVEDTAAALSEVREIYQQMLQDDCLVNTSVWYETAECALQTDVCSGECVEKVDEFPPHCRVNSSVDDPLEDLQNILSENARLPGMVVDFSSCRDTLTIFENLLFCSYDQLLALTDSGVGDGLYENCQARKLYNSGDYWNGRLFLQSQQCILKSQSNCETGATSISVSDGSSPKPQPPLPTLQDNATEPPTPHGDGDTATQLPPNVFLPAILGFITLLCFSFL
eukprot:TRINITY_DN3541_c0_g1_i3.p1 TRINITY_DN3541_c0_g1~~TRINITY_DN3541_c0_g1_i3.p1  ORF type:complete len:327 (+),score=48.54 TRINITY_DN3541_c0_g1_i3:138-1118(+)